MERIKKLIHEGRIFLGYLFIWTALFTTLVWFSGQQYNILPSYSLAGMAILFVIGLVLSWQKKNRPAMSKWSWLLPTIVLAGISALLAFDSNLKDSTNINIFMVVAAFISLLPTIVQFWRFLNVFRKKK